MHPKQMSNMNDDAPIILEHWKELEVVNEYMYLCMVKVIIWEPGIRNKNKNSIGLHKEREMVINYNVKLGEGNYEDYVVDPV